MATTTTRRRNSVKRRQHGIPSWKYILGFIISLIALLARAKADANDATGDDYTIISQHKSAPETRNEPELNYHCTFRNLWTPDRHPVNYPSYGLWEGLTVWSHQEDYQLWGPGVQATYGLQVLAEDGVVDPLHNELEGVLVYDYNSYSEFHYVLQSFYHLPPVRASKEYPYLSSLVQLYPSPDWFTGFYNLSVVVQNINNEKEWINHFKVQTYPWSAGTKQGDSYDDFNSQTFGLPRDPPWPIYRITANDDFPSPANGELQDPTSQTVLPVAEWECYGIPIDDDIDILLTNRSDTCDYFLDPCCNAAPNCNNTLPYNIEPNISLAVEEALYPQINFVCNFMRDSCPIQVQHNALCDGEGFNCDCFDCDPCQQFNYDCSGCTQSGCLWCPGDAFCSSYPLDASYWALYGNYKTSSCNEPQEWISTCDSGTKNDNVFSDPLYDSMSWVYKLIHVEPVWREGITGAGVHVRIIDDGVDASHPEFDGRFDYESSCDAYLPESPTRNRHGTAVASIVAGAADNGVCATGIAPGATISSCVLINSEEGSAALFANKVEGVDIISNSWGPYPCEIGGVLGRRSLQGGCPFTGESQYNPCAVCDDFSGTGDLSYECLQTTAQYCSRYYERDPMACAEYMDNFIDCNYQVLGPGTAAAFENLVLEGRGGRGTIITFAAGNEYSFGSDTNFDGYMNSRFTIAVGATGKDGKHASYSTPGASLFISAPGGDNENLSNNIVAQPGGGCHDITAGTSFAAPVVTGVIALLLQVNPELSWRDVQGILAWTARKVDPADLAWTTNSAGYFTNNKYGFGLVDAEEAVAEAKTWKHWGPEKQILVESGNISLAVLDDPEAVATSTIIIEDGNVMLSTGAANIATEAVLVYLDLLHPSRGDLLVSLTGPDGITSILAPSKRPENTLIESEERWKLMTIKHWGTNPTGNWTLEIVDEKSGTLEDCVDLPWEFDHQGSDNPLSCDSFWDVLDNATEACYDEEIGGYESGGRTMREACCLCGGGVPVSDIAPTLRSWRMIAYGHEVSSRDIKPPHEQFSCTFSNDTCPFTMQFDGRCDDDTEECSNADCFDCDPYNQAHSFGDCESCATTGGVWCPGDAICMSTPLDESFWSQYHGLKLSSCNSTTEWVSRCDGQENDNPFHDPLYDAMAWSYKLINVEPVWESGISGKNISVRIIDDGVDSSHAEFPNFDVSNSCTENRPKDINKNMHGTACASIVGAAGDNDICAVGIAPGASLSSCVVTQVDDGSQKELFLYKLENIDVFSASWGPQICRAAIDTDYESETSTTCPFTANYPENPCVTCNNFATSELSEECELATAYYCLGHPEADRVACAEFLDLFVSCGYYSLDRDTNDAFAKVALEGRGGKGAIIVMSAGNGYNAFEDVNNNGFTNSRFTISVAAVGKDGKHASYSTPGAAVFLSAPGGDNENLSNNIVAKPGGGCHDITVGTSFSCPVVSGVVALVLEANPELGWRDIQAILALTSRKTDPENESWKTNAAGMNRSNLYGFGVVDAYRAVEIAKSWERLEQEQRFMATSRLVNLPIEDDNSETTTAILSLNRTEILHNRTDIQDIRAEAVVLYLDIVHPSRGDLNIVLTSPSGTTSTLALGSHPENRQVSENERWKFMTLDFYGEAITGDFELQVRDVSPGIIDSCSDLMWQYVNAEAGFEITCFDFSGVTDCRNESEVSPAILSIIYEERTVLDSCCACGGGVDVTKVESQIRSWTLLVYGHSSSPFTSAPTLALTAAPTKSPSTAKPGLIDESSSSESPSRTTIIAVGTNATSPSSSSVTISPIGTDESAIFNSTPTIRPTPAPELLEPVGELPATISSSAATGNATGSSPPSFASSYNQRFTFFINAALIAFLV